MNNEIYLQLEQVELMESINGYNPYIDSRSGTVEWYKDDSDVVVYATPNWDGEGGTCPIAYSNIETGDYTDVGSISFVGLTMEQQIEKYRNMVDSTISTIILDK